MVDLSLVLDVSSSIGPQWAAVRDAARTFVNSFDAAHDRLALLTFSDGAQRDRRDAREPRVRQDRADQRRARARCPAAAPTWWRASIAAWDELRSVPAGRSRASGSSCCSPTARPTACLATTGRHRGVGLRTYDFPQNAGDTHGQTWNSPHITGLYDTQTGANSMGIDTTRSVGLYQHAVRRQHCVAEVPACSRARTRIIAARAFRRRFRCRPRRSTWTACRSRARAD